MYIILTLLFFYVFHILFLCFCFLSLHMYIYVWSIVMCILSEMRKKRKHFGKSWFGWNKNISLLALHLKAINILICAKIENRAKKKHTNSPWGIFIFDISKYQQNNSQICCTIPTPCWMCVFFIQREIQCFSHWTVLLSCSNRTQLVLCAKE